MGNLGLYQAMTAGAKRGGGPVELGIIFWGTGYMVGRVCESGIKFVVRKLRQPQQQECYRGKLFTVNGIYLSDDGFQLKFGDKFEVLEQDSGAALIKKIGDSNNPYMVSLDILRQLSDFNQIDSMA